MLFIFTEVARFLCGSYLFMQFQTMESGTVENTIATVKGKEWTVQRLLMNESYIKIFANLLTSIMKIIPLKAGTSDEGGKIAMQT